MLGNKDEIVCPRSLELGVVQNFRCSWKKRKEVWETRPYKDSWAEEFLATLGGEKAFTFTHEEGIAARKRAVELVNRGEIAPPRNWDQKFLKDGGTMTNNLPSGNTTRDSIVEPIDTPREDFEHALEVEEVESVGGSMAELYDEYDKEYTND